MTPTRQLGVLAATLWLSSLATAAQAAGPPRNLARGLTVCTQAPATTSSVRETLRVAAEAAQAATRGVQATALPLATRTTEGSARGVINRRPHLLLTPSARGVYSQIRSSLRNVAEADLRPLLRDLHPASEIGWVELPTAELFPAQEMERLYRILPTDRNINLKGKGSRAAQLAYLPWLDVRTFWPYRDLLEEAVVSQFASWGEAVHLSRFELRKGTDARRLQASGWHYDQGAYLTLVTPLHGPTTSAQDWDGNVFSVQRGNTLAFSGTDRTKLYDTVRALYHKGSTGNRLVLMTRFSRVREATPLPP